MEINYLLDLTDLENSDIKYKISHFPDGQQNIVLELQAFEAKYLMPDVKMHVTINTRVNNWNDMEILLAAKACIETSGLFHEKHLYLPYLLGARSDRKFEEGGNNYLRDVIAPVINSMGFESVKILDPHSDVTEAVIDNIYIEHNIEFIQLVLDYLGRDINLVCPDAGAQKKMWGIVEELQLEQGFITASKHRDVKTGKITHTECNIRPDSKGKPYLIIDDICDGGRTFIEISKAIREQDPAAIVLLAVTHGIFSAGVDELKKHFVQIYCTNSYSDIEENYSYHGEVRQLNGFIKQYKVI